MKKTNLLVALSLALSNVYAQEGALDPSFGTAGKYQTTENYNAESVALQADGKIILAGTRFDANGVDFGVFRHESNSDVDLTFGTNGATIIDFFGATDAAKEVAVLPDGKIIVVGEVIESSIRKLGIVRLTSNGAIDNSFGNAGKVVIEISGATNLGIEDMILLPSGKMLIAGTKDGFSLALLVMVDANGNLDSSFDGDGVFQSNLIQNAFSIAVQNDGKILMAGSALLKATIVRLNANGTLDSSFGVNGVYTNATMTFGALGAFIDLQSDGKIVCAYGSFASSEVYYMRILADGTLDASFATAGQGSFNVAGNDYPTAIEILPSDKILVVGSAYTNSSTTDGFIARIEANGTIDNAFGTNGVTMTSIRPTEIDDFLDLAIQADGKILVTGVECGGSCRYTAVRYLASEGVNSISENELMNALTLYPNPANDVIRFKGIDFSHGILVELHTLEGKTILTEMSFDGLINVSGLQNGVYIAKLSSNSGETGSVRFTKI